MDRRLAEDLFTALYRHLLGREPDPAGLEAWVTAAIRDPDLDQLIADFVSADEFRQFRSSEVWKTASSTRSLPGVTDVAFPDVARLFEIASRYWRRVGCDPSGIYHSVHTSVGNRVQQDADRRLAFINKGAETVGAICDLLYSRGRVPFEEATCLDFGCGVGRLAINAARRFARVYAVDFSKGHLDEMVRNIELVEPGVASHVEAMHLQKLEDTGALPKVDYCYSLLTLQHNPPPVIAYLVKALLDRLNPGGVAALHVPIHHPFYSFDLAEYLASEAAGSTMEMHILPREDLGECVRASGCTIRDSVNWGYTKGIYSEIFVITKP